VVRTCIAPRRTSTGGTALTERPSHGVERSAANDQTRIECVHAAEQGIDRRRRCLAAERRRVERERGCHQCDNEARVRHRSASTGEQYPKGPGFEMRKA
jgi:hypothetical protein